MAAEGLLHQEHKSFTRLLWSVFFLHPGCKVTWHGLHKVNPPVIINMLYIYFHILVIIILIILSFLRDFESDQ